MLARAAAGARNPASTSASFVDLAAGEHDGGVRGSRFVLRQRFERRGRAGEQAIRVGEPIALGAKALGLAIGESQRFELGNLKTRELDLGFPLRARGAAILELLDERVPSGEILRDSLRERRDLVVRVEQRALVAGVEQGLVRVLALDVDEQSAERLQVLKVHGLTVDERSRAPVGADEPA